MNPCHRAPNLPRKPEIRGSGCASMASSGSRTRTADALLTFFPSSGERLTNRITLAASACHGRWTHGRWANLFPRWPTRPLLALGSQESGWQHHQSPPLEQPPALGHGLDGRVVPVCAGPAWVRLVVGDYELTAGGSTA